MTTPSTPPPLRASHSRTSDYQPNGVLVTPHEDPLAFARRVEAAPPQEQHLLIGEEVERVLAAKRSKCGCFPHGPDEPCTCDGCWACKGRVVGCTCDIAWDCEHGGAGGAS